MKRLSIPQDQPTYHEGYEAYKLGLAKNPFENLSQKFQAQRVYWEMGWQQAELDLKAEKTMNSLPDYTKV